MTQGSSRIRRQLDRFDNGGVIVLRFVDARRYRPHAHRLSREGPHEVARVGLVVQPTNVVAGREDQRHAIVDTGH
jgi:hypothetical protein